MTIKDALLISVLRAASKSAEEKRLTVGEGSYRSVEINTMFLDAAADRLEELLGVLNQLGERPLETPGNDYREFWQAWDQVNAIAQAAIKRGS